MKQIFMAILFVFATMCLSAQITNIHNADSTVVLKDLYAGGLQSTEFSVDSLSTKNWGGLRFGARASCEISKTFSIQSLFVIDVNSGAPSQTINAFTISTKIGKRFVWMNGKGGQASTFLHRPFPSTMSGHFETWTSSQIPGIAPVSHLAYLKDNLVIRGSVSYKNHTIETHLGFSIQDKWKISGWCSDGENYGVAVSTNHEKVATTTFFDQEKIGHRTWLMVYPVWGAYVDAGLAREDWGIIRGEFGLIRTFEFPQAKLAGLAGMGYSREINSVKAYLMVNLAEKKKNKV